MQAMILAAGEGKRLRPLTLTCPKPLLPVAGRPLIDHTLDWLYHYGIRDVALNLHYLPEMIANYLGTGSRFGMRVSYSYEKTLLGTAGALSLLRDFFNQTFVVVHGDLLVDVDLAPLIDLHRRRRSLATLGLRYTDIPESQLAVAVDYQRRITAVASAPTAWGSDTVSAGVCILEPQVLDYIPAGEPCDFGSALVPHLLKAGLPIYAQPVWGYLLDINSHAAYAHAQEDWSQAEHVIGI